MYEIPFQRVKIKAASVIIDHQDPEIFTVSLNSLAFDTYISYLPWLPGSI